MLSNKNRLYLRYVLRHKWLVFAFGLRRRAPIWRLIVHDWSKFLPWEWGPYAEFFYGRADGQPWGPVVGEAKKALATKVSSDRQAYLATALDKHAAFMQAFLSHLHLNPHHHQHWRLPTMPGKPEQVFPMPESIVREMIADWDGAGAAINGRYGTPAWYAKQSDIVLHPDTRALVERILAESL